MFGVVCGDKCNYYSKNGTFRFSQNPKVRIQIPLPQPIQTPHKIGTHILVNFNSFSFRNCRGPYFRAYSPEILRIKRILIHPVSLTFALWYSLALPSKPQSGRHYLLMKPYRHTFFDLGCQDGVTPTSTETGATWFSRESGVERRSSTDSPSFVRGESGSGTGSERNSE